MKRKLSLLLCAALTLSLLAGCGPKNTGNGSASGSDSTSQSTSQNTGDRTQVDFMVLSGPTGVGAAKLLSDNDAGTTLNDYNAEVVTENGQIQTALTSGEVDIAAIATNVAANLAAQRRANVLAINDDEAIEAAYELTKLEGIIPALESAHALGALRKLKFKPEDIVVLTVSGRGDKDIETYLSFNEQQ